MTTIHRAAMPITDRQYVTLTGYTRTLHVAHMRRHIAQREGIASPWIEVWYEVHDDVPITVRFDVHGTGHDFDHYGQHVGTVTTNNGQLVWHVYAEQVPSDEEVDQ